MYNEKPKEKGEIRSEIMQDQDPGLIDSLDYYDQIEDIIERTEIASGEKEFYTTFNSSIDSNIKFKNGPEASAK